jgi:hypothetical protein
LDASQLLALWETGQARHAIDRALLLFASARPNWPVEHLADRPLGQRNQSLLDLRARTFGADIEAQADCPACGETMSLDLHVDDFLAQAAPDDLPAEFEVSGCRFRLPNSRDLAHVADEPEGDAAAFAMLQRCCVESPAGQDLAALLPQVEAALARWDPLAEIELSLTCASCGHAWAAPFDIGALLWDDIAARASGLLADVHTLAAAYGWAERDILALSELRRAAYLGWVRQ